MINPQSFKPNSPEWVMAKFLDCWKRRAFKQILSFVQSSWLAKQADPSNTKRIREALNFKKLLDSEFVQNEAFTGVVAVFLVKLKYRYYSIEEEDVCEIKLFKERKDWRVDPNYKVKT